MGLMEEYNDAKEWVQTSLDLNSVRKYSFFYFSSQQNVSFKLVEMGTKYGYIMYAY